MALGAWSDANDVFAEALEVDPASIEVRRHWAELFLEKYRPDEAGALVAEALEQAPGHPWLLTLAARIALDTAYDIDAASALLSRALAIHPDMPEALEVLVELDLDQRRFDEADARLGRIEEHAPGRLETLALRGAFHWIRGDRDRFRDVEDEVLRRYPTGARFYHVVGEIAVRNFRYVDAMELFQQALELDAGYWRAFVSLGIGHSRLGDDERALDFLRRAFDNDPFNQRAYYMIGLFEETLESYRLFDDPLIDGVRYRFHQLEAPVLERIVPPAMQAVWDTYVDRYGIVPQTPVQYEILHDVETFSVRSVGLPWAAPHGICFGRVVTSRSPNAGDFSWRQVLEHEMSHVFQLNLSDYRVPRWFTEGLAEYDSVLNEPGWRREEELAVAGLLRRNGYIPVDELNLAFVTGDVIAAYFQAYLAVEFIGEEWGYEALLAMMRAWSEGRMTSEVFSTVLATDLAAFDERFEASLRARFADQIALFDPSIDELLSNPGPDAVPGFAEAARMIREGQVEDRYDEIVAELQRAAPNPEALYLLAVLHGEAGELQRERASWRALIDAGYESYRARVALAEFALDAADRALARHHIDAAITSYPSGVDAWRQRVRLERLDGRAPSLRAALEQLSHLDEGDASSALELAGLALAAGDIDSAARFARRAVDVAPFTRDVASLAGRVAHARGEHEMAIQWLQREFDLGAVDRDRTLSQLADSARVLGRDEDALRYDRMRSDPSDDAP
jgi:tetratricopeptide (TPR) repeat protein